MRRIWRLVRRISLLLDLPFTQELAELDALALEEDEESTSYLADLNKAPDFVDEPPVELSEVSRLLWVILPCHLTYPCRRPNTMKRSRPQRRHGRGAGSIALTAHVSMNLMKCM